jgi:hypothetical protein
MTSFYQTRHQVSANMTCTAYNNDAHFLTSKVTFIEISVTIKFGALLRLVVKGFSHPLPNHYTNIPALAKFN